MPVDVGAVRYESDHAPPALLGPTTLYMWRLFVSFFPQEARDTGNGRLTATLTGEDILVSVFALVFWLLAFFAGIQQFALLLLKYLIVDK